MTPPTLSLHPGEVGDTETRHGSSRKKYPPSDNVDSHLPFRVSFSICSPEGVMFGTPWLIFCQPRCPPGISIECL
jgi:hypothetical protein